ncbi:GNAT family N-acetyltransferase [Devosia sp.]|uniref:GNAT family N-acetyltransferase n=1 Tax=Devosia sp. TaxID=1871048 RepID=UPI00344ED972
MVGGLAAFGQDYKRTSARIVRTNGRMFRVRSATRDDAVSLIAVWRETWPATYTATLGARAVEVMLDDLDRHGTASLLPEIGAKGLCLLDGNEVVGTAIHSVGRSVVYLWGMYVMPRYQRSGAGTLLYRSVQEAARGQPVEVRVVRSSNQAVNFYRKLEFQTVGEEATEIMPHVQAVCLTMRHPA